MLFVFSAVLTLMRIAQCLGLIVLHLFYVLFIYIFSFWKD